MGKDTLLDIGAIALGGCANPTFATVITPASWTIVDADGLMDRRGGGRNSLIAVNTDQVTSQVMFAAK